VSITGDLDAVPEKTKGTTQLIDFIKAYPEFEPIIEL
jgi:hypothetical protein